MHAKLKQIQRNLSAKAESSLMLVLRQTRPINFCMLVLQKKKKTFNAVKNLNVVVRRWELSNFFNKKK